MKTENRKLKAAGWETHRREAAGVAWIAVMLMLGICFADYSGSTYTDLAGTTGLTIVAVKTDSCTGTPPAVTIMGGAPQYAYTDCGSGIYWRTLPDGNYHLFQSTTWLAQFAVRTDTLQDQITAIGANSWVTNARLASNAVTTAKIQDAAVTLAKLGSNAVDATKITDGSVVWADLGAAFKGSSPDESFTIKAMQDTLRLMKGTGWNSATDYSLNTLDSLMKLMVLDLTFSVAPNCSVRVNSYSAQYGISVVWSMNSAHNDSAVQRYEVYMTMGTPAIGTQGFISQAQLDNLRALMQLYQIRYDSWHGGSVFVPGSGTIYVVIVAFDWYGTYVGSAVSYASSSQTGIGEISSLIGAPGYTSGNTMTVTLRDALNNIAGLQTGMSAFSGQVRIQVFAESHISGGGLVDNAADMTLFTSNEVGTPSKTKIRGSYVRTSGYNNLSFYGMTRMTSISEKGYLFLTSGGNTATYTVGGNGTAGDTVSTAFALTLSVTGMTADQPAEYSVQASVANANDTVRFWDPVIYLVK